MRILLIEDDRSLSSYVQSGLRESGHAVDVCLDGRDGLVQAASEDYDLLIVDRGLPSLDGLALVKTLRRGGNHVPVLFLTALGDLDQRVEGLRAGGDDYLTKPFAFSELLARVESLLRRGLSTAQDTELTVGDLALNLRSREASRNGREIELLPREYALLKFLMRHVGQVVTRTMLLEKVWDYHFDPQTNVIDVHISRLRRKIEAPGEPTLLHTVRGVGYIMKGES